MTQLKKSLPKTEIQELLENYFNTIEWYESINGKITSCTTNHPDTKTFLKSKGLK